MRTAPVRGPCAPVPSMLVTVKLPRLRSGAAMLAVLASGWLLTAAPVGALDQAPKLGLTPVDHAGAFFEVTLEPGEGTVLRVEAANFGAVEVDARTYAADVYSIINGGFGADLYGEPGSGTTLWVDYPAQIATLDAQDALVIDFEVRVPEGTPPGEYVAALVIENVEPFRGSGSVTIDQVNRSAIAVAIDVPGLRQPELQIGSVGHHVAGTQSVITFAIDNPGNMHLRPAGDFRLFDASGRELSAGPVSMDSVYAGTGTLLEAPLANLLPEGEYCAELRLVDEETGAADQTECLAFTVGPESAAAADAAIPASAPTPPWLPSTDAMRQAAPFIVIGLVLVLVTLAFLVVARRRRRRAGA
jgi:LPXTG-motif cell wall-anchored protein